MSVEEATIPKPEAEQVPVVSMTEAEATPATKAEESTVGSEVEIAKRAFALGNYEEAVDHYATALELARNEYGEDTSQFAELLLAYGRSLIENAISHNTAPETNKYMLGSSGDSKAQPGNGRIYFGDGASSDGEDFKRMKGERKMKKQTTMSLKTTFMLHGTFSTSREHIMINKRVTI
ncbi:HAT1-interacting factor 1 [Rhizoctonia solani AG-1 IB]|uniref:HAT1-interacting factor 1 n=1 Tax=Thanatephorus cucumeris (strain AG1-IB / isolate 7/3/14) TaxID=1108050 RepID=M5BUF0_THACB|nr:HAT1-interacting factor 1 [Rhizoctonia solani AG-1 IB]